VTTKNIPIKKEYKNIANDIRSGKLACSTVTKYFNNKQFFEWYKNKYFKDGKEV